MAISAIIGAISTAGAALGLTATVGGFLGMGLFGHFLVTTAMGAALNALAPKPKAPTISGSQGYQINGAQGYQINGASGSALDHQIIYGEARVGGVRIYDAATGSNNEFLHRIVAFAGHEIDSYQQIYLNDEVVTLDGNGNVTSPSRYNGYVRIKRYLGTDAQAADSDLVAETSGLTDGRWTSAHRLRGIAYVYVRFQFNADVFPNGIPAVSAKIRGRKVYDPRTTTTAWSRNAALCIRDYLTAAHGLAQSSGRIDDTLVTTAANICDQSVDGESRFTCNGAFTTGQEPAQILTDLLTSVGGILWYGQGKWRMRAAAYQTPVLTLDEDDLRSSINVSTRHSRRDNFNSVKGTFSGDETDWQPADYPEVNDGGTYLVTDNNVPNVLDFPLPFTSSSKTAQRIARIALRRNREQLTVSASFGLRAFAVQVGDNIALTNTRFGWSQKPFEVLSWTFGLVEGQDIHVQMTLREISSAVFTDENPAVFELNNTTLPDRFFVPSVGITPSQELQTINEEVVGILVASVSASSPFAVEEVEVQFRPSAETNWRALGTGQPGRFEIVLAQSGNYDIRARARNYLGVRGDWTVISSYYFGPFEAPPAQPQNFVANVIGGTAHLSWSPVPDLDLSHYRIRFSPLTSGATVSDSVDLIPKLSRPGVSASVPAQTGTYFIQAVDKLGIAGQPASLVITVDMSQIQNLNVVDTLTENPSFTGAKASVAVGEAAGLPALILDTDILFDSVTGDFDDALGLFDAGFNSVSASGTYEFSNYIDLGEKYTSRVSTSLTSYRTDYSNTFDSAQGDFDMRAGDFDGDTIFTDVSAKVQISFTDDNPAGSPVWSAWQDFLVGDVAARALRFRAVLGTSNSSATPSVTALSAQVDMPDRVEAESDITFTGSRVVTFPVAFKAVPSLGVALANLTDGQRYAITSKTRTGFTITVYDTGGGVATNAVDLDYVAKGYGRELP